MARCTCTECACDSTFDCLHHEDGTYCKCCTYEEDGVVYHREELMVMEEG